MSPAGYWPQLQVAIEAGADAVYFGLKHFTARAKVGFSLSELPEVMQTLHKRGVKGYLTFNTLIFDHEFLEAAKSLAAIAQTGVDAIIVQDLGIAKLASKIAPELELHGSTQMSITNADGIKLAQDFGISRVVLARELSLGEIREIRKETNCELEMFVHGALCVSYSGQCFSSEAWGGRSANRGQCAQACRLPYEILVDNKIKPLGDARYLLSPGDLYALHQLPEIVQLGVSALKIEGRYKDADYVALTTQAYRKAVDEAWEKSSVSITKLEELQLEQVYSRGLGAYFISGTNHQEVVKGRSPRHRGVLIGKVVKTLSESVIIKPEKEVNKLAPLKAGDGVVFDAADWNSPQEIEEGGRVYKVVITKNHNLELYFGNNSVNFGRIREGDLLWRTDDPELEKVVKPFIKTASPISKQPIKAFVKAYEGNPLAIEWQLVKNPNLCIAIKSKNILTQAQNRSTTKDFIFDQLSRLGNTPYKLIDIDLEIVGNPFIASSLLNDLRRQAVEKLIELQATPKQISISEPLLTLETSLEEVAKMPLLKEEEMLLPQLPQLHLLVRTVEQLDAAIELQPASITLDYLDLYGLKPSVEKLEASKILARVASPRILKPGESKVLDFLLKLGCEILVRASGMLSALQDIEHPKLIGDFSLNAANVLSANALLNLGLSRLTPTHDLNADQIAILAQEVGKEKIEVVAYQHLPVFHTEHCVFCRFLSTGTSYKDCGHPCEKHRVSLKDLNGRLHPVMADVGCRNTVFGAEAQEASLHLEKWLTVGIKHFRLEFVHESAKEVKEISQAFEKALNKELPFLDLSKKLQKLSPQGTTEGSLFVAKNYRSLPLL
ncbi:MAG: U32 family peptidase [Acidobacteria bacterium]|nr:U32 family peptidase [Acidobacteriota bacterium]